MLEGKFFGLFFWDLVCSFFAGLFLEIGGLGRVLTFGSPIFILGVPFLIGFRFWVSDYGVGDWEWGRMVFLYDIRFPPFLLLWGWWYWYWDLGSLGWMVLG